MTTTADRPTLSPSAAFALVAAIIGLALFASTTPSPLYETYRELWGFSPVVLTLVYATYAFGVLATLILAGRISDDVGRRPVLLIALTTLMAATVLFMVADSVIWLFVARASRASRPASPSAPPARRRSTCTRAATRPVSA